MGMKSHQTIESMIEEGIVSGDLAAKAEIFILIDNSVGKAAFYKGNSTSEAQFNLVLRLWLLDMQGNIKLQLLHVAGTHMIEQGTDGLPIGNLLTEGVMSGKPMLSYIPLDKDPFQWWPPLLAWV